MADPLPKTFEEFLGIDTSRRTATEARITGGLSRLFDAAEEEPTPDEHPDPPNLEGWTLLDGIALARELEQILEPLGSHCALGGSVLHSGASTKDLDIFLYRHDHRYPFTQPIFDALINKGFSKPVSVNNYPNFDSYIFKTYYQNRRIDLFFLHK